MDVMEVAENFNKWFWSESFWLPPNSTWKDLERDETIFLPHAQDLWLAFPVAGVLMILRFLWETLIAGPFAKRCGLKNYRPRPPAHNEILESAFLQKRSVPSHDRLEDLSKKTDLTTRQVERWWRRRRVQGRPSEVAKFRETSWRFLFYLFAFYYGIFVLWDKPWFWDTKHCWYDYPRQHVDNEIYWYYMVEMGFYWSLVFSLVVDEKRKDFAEQIVHHIATILLLVLSWADNMIRVGTLVLVVHDAVDYWMELAKMCKYLKYHKICDILFVIFTVVWFITRLCIYPFRIIRCTLMEAHYIITFFPMYYVYNVLLCTLQVLHIFWFYLICRIAYIFIRTGQVAKDERSETEPDSTDDDEKWKRKLKSSPNGMIMEPMVNGNNNVKPRMNGHTD